MVHDNSQSTKLPFDLSMEAIIDRGDESSFGGGKPDSAASASGLVESGLQVIDQGDSIIAPTIDQDTKGEAVEEVSPQKEESFIKQLDDQPYTSAIP